VPGAPYWIWTQFVLRDQGVVWRAIDLERRVEVALPAPRSGRARLHHPGSFPDLFLTVFSRPEPTLTADQ